MSLRKVIVVVGATGNQGSSVVNTFIHEPEWHVRGISRNVNSEASKALSARGVEMVTANLDDPDSLDVAFAGATAIFGVTDFWKPMMDPANHAKLKSGQTINEWCYEYEKQQAKNIIDASAKISSLQRFIWSSLSYAKKWSNGKYTWVYHFDGKAEAAEYGQQTYPELWQKTSIIQIGVYMSNFLNHPMVQPRKIGPDAYQVTGNAPRDTKMPLIATEEDTGPFVKALIEAGPGKNLIAYRAWLSTDEFIHILAKTLGVSITFKEVEFEAVVNSLPASVGREIAETWAYASEFGYEARADHTVVHPKDLGVELSLPSVEAWIEKQDWSAIIKG